MEIQTLNPEVVNQIAAGEVVERPAHLVKELLENSLDAGATEVEIDLDQGGRQVRVRDNGRGMLPTDLPLALARHATSKIHQANDLWSLETYGFRGEALASISAVSDLTLISRRQGQAEAYEIKSHFGELKSPVRVGGEEGTQVWIRDLFANLPARLKFLKSESAEIAQIKNVVRAMALASPGVGFRVRHKGKLLHRWPAATEWIQRAQQVLEFQPLYECAGEENGIKVRAAFSAPHEVVGNNRQMWVFVRGRWVTDRSLIAAILEAYRNLLMHGEYPVAVLWIDCPPDEVDVNIHPTKSQVKFRQPSQVFRAVVHVLRAALEKAPWLEGILRDPGVASSFRADAAESSLAPSTSVPTPTTVRWDSPELNRTQYQQKSAWQPPSEIRSPAVTFEVLRNAAQGLGEVNGGEEPVSVTATGRWSSLQVLGQAALTYIIAQNSDGLILIDQHAAHERVAFEELMQAWKARNMPIQDFLLPLPLTFSGERLEALMTAAPELETVGLTLEQLGPETVAVRSAPNILKDVAIERALRWLADEMLESGGSFALEKVVGELFATMACHSVVRAGQALSLEEMRSLLQQMDRFAWSSFCPHGRPVFVEYSFQQLERDFGRRQ